MTLTSAIPRTSRLASAVARAKALPRSRAFLALADQGVASLGNFATIIIVLRALSPAHFGIYQMMTEVYLFLNSIQAALVVYPLLVKGAAMDRDGLRRLSGACMILTLALGLVLSLGMLGAAGFTHSFHALWLVAPVAMLLAQVQELLRRTLIAHLRFAAAIPGDAISYVLQAAVLWLLVKHNALTLPAVFFTMAATSALAALVQAIQIGIRFDIRTKELRRLAAECLGMGKWIVLANLATVIAFMGYSWTLFYTHGAAQVGQFGVIANTLRFANPIVAALAGGIVPAVSRANALGNIAQARRAAFKFGGLAAAFLIPFFGLLLLFPVHSLAILCKGQTEYLSLAPLLRIYTLAFACTAANSFVLAYLNGLGYSRINFIGMGANAVVSLFLGLPLVALWGVRGVIYGGGTANLVMLVVTIFFAVRYKHKVAPGPSETVPQSAIEAEAVLTDSPTTPG